MASISGTTNSNMVSSLYNSGNIISGLASGLDTEGMIENLVKSYQTKINSLNQQVTKTEWKQDAYRSIISKMVGFSQKYTSYNSPATNLLSRSFFTNAVKVATQGLNKDKVTASGKTSSDISLNAVHQLATAAQYRVGDSRLNSGDGKSIESATAVDLMGKTTLGALQGTMTVTYGSQKLNINFDEVADKKTLEDIEKKTGKTGADALAELINQKLEGQKITFSNGQSEKAEDRVKAVVENGSIVFKDQKASAGNALYISQASGNVAETLGLDTDKLTKDNNINSFKLDGLKGADGNVSLTRQENTAEYLSGKAMSLTLNGSTKTIYLPKITGSEADGYSFQDKDGNTVKLDEAGAADKYAAVVNEAVQKAFKGKVEVSNVGTDGKLQLNFNVKEDGSDLRINSDVGEALGIGQTATTYLNTNKTLENLLDLSKLTPTGKDDKGNDLYAFELNGVTIGKYTKDAKLSDILNDINSNKDAGVKVSYSQTTKEFLFSAKETGADSEIVMGGGLAQAMFGDTSAAGFDASQKVSGILGDRSDYNGPYNNFALNVGGIDLNLHVDGNSDMNSIVADLNGMLSVIGPAEGVNYTAEFDSKTNSIVVRDNNDNGKAVNVTYGKGLAADLFSKVGQMGSGSYTAGQDAKFTATINGRQMEMTRSSNSVDIDGLTINMKETFDSSYDKDGNQKLDAAGKPVYSAESSVTFKSTTDSDKIVDAVKAMIEDYNAMIGEIRTAYSTLPAQKTDGSSYEPLSEDDMEGWSQSAIDRYEEKAKQGILFGDRDLSSLYNKLQNVFAPAGQDGAVLRGIGINNSYDVGTGTLTITLDEDKLRAMLDSDPDLVADAFTKTNGVMQNMKNTLDTYAKTSGEPKGILIQKAGSPLSPLSLMNNTWQKQIDNYNKQVEKWQDKLSSQVDRYTKQFSRLEQLIQQMNSQSSTLSGLMGG